MDEAPGSGVLYITSMSSSMAAGWDEPNVGGVGVREDSLKERNAFFFWKERVIQTTTDHHAAVLQLTWHGCRYNSISMSIYQFKV